MSTDPVKFVDVGDARMAYRTRGSGPPLLLVHGWPLSALTWEKLVPHLEGRFTCIRVDLAGAGETEWDERTDFRFPAQARRLSTFLERLGVEACDLVAQDTGATITRLLAADDAGRRIQRMVLLNTELPGHRPPWIPLFRWLMFLPGTNRSFRSTMRSPAFLRSSLGFGGCFHDTALIEGDFKERIIAPLLESPRRMEGQIRYLRGLDWRVVDGLRTTHAAIRIPVLLVWGEEDPTFPLEEARRRLVEQLPDCRGLKLIPKTRLLPHEERPDLVAAELLSFLAPQSRGPGAEAHR